MKKKFLISIDTEGDNLWSWTIGQPITTQNTKYLSRFQKLCDEYDFKPTYLTNYEMAMDEEFVEFAKEVMDRGGCEVGMHLHAWNSPPEIELPIRKDGIPGAPYLIEYPTEVMEKKIKFMTELLENKFGKRPITHRAGRWAMDERYFELLDKYGYVVDCSVTPGINWNKANGQTEYSKGSDYTEFATRPYVVNNTNIVEVPMTIRENHLRHKNQGEGIRKAVRNYYRAIKGQGKIWLRPNGNNLKEMLYLVNKISSNKKDDYIMFMLHSSELMPGGSPRFETEDKIEKVYADLKELFEVISRDYEGDTIGNYSLSLKRGI